MSKNIIKFYAPLPLSYTSLHWVNFVPSFFEYSYVNFRNTYQLSERTLLSVILMLSIILFVLQIAPNN